MDGLAPGDVYTAIFKVKWDHNAKGRRERQASHLFPAAEQPVIRRPGKKRRCLFSLDRHGCCIVVQTHIITHTIAMPMLFLLRKRLQLAWLR